MSSSRSTPSAGPSSGMTSLVTCVAALSRCAPRRLSVFAGTLCRLEVAVWCRCLVRVARRLSISAGTPCHSRVWRLVPALCSCDSSSFHFCWGSLSFSSSTPSAGVALHRSLAALSRGAWSFGVQDSLCGECLLTSWRRWFCDVGADDVTSTLPLSPSVAGALFPRTFTFSVSFVAVFSLTSCSCALAAALWLLRVHSCPSTA